MLVQARDTNADTQHFAADQCHALRNALDLEYLRWIADIERTGSWQHDAVPSLEYWISVRYGVSIETARDDVLLARTLPTLPRIAQAYSEGLLSKQKLVVLCAFVEPDDDEAWSVDAQRYSVSYLRRCRRFARRRKREEAAEADRLRELTMHWDYRSEMLRFSGQLPGADGALLKKAIERIAGEPQRDIEGNWLSLRERQADALVALASVHLGADADPVRSTVVVHVDARDLNHVNGIASLDDGPVVPSEVARRMSCCGNVECVIEGEDGKPISIGRRSRIIPKPLLWEIRERDRQCVCCGSTFLLPTEGHHMVPWAHGGETSYDNLVLVCLRCHRSLHERGYRVFWNDDGTVGVRRPDGSVVKNRPTPLEPAVKERFFGPPARRTSVRE